MLSPISSVLPFCGRLPMASMALSHSLPLPRGWSRRVCSAVVQVISLARTSQALMRGHLVSPDLRPLRCLHDRWDSYPAGTTFAGAGLSPAGTTSLHSRRTWASTPKRIQVHLQVSPSPEGIEEAALTHSRAALVERSPTAPFIDHYPIFTSMDLICARSDFGRWTLSTPSMNSAATLLPSASSGSVKLRAKRPYARSTR